MAASRFDQTSRLPEVRATARRAINAPSSRKTGSRRDTIVADAPKKIGKYSAR